MSYITLPPQKETSKLSLQRILLIVLAGLLRFNIFELGYYFYLKFYSSNLASLENGIFTNLGIISKDKELAESELQKNEGSRSFSDEYIGFLGVIEEKEDNYFWVVSKKEKVRVNVSESTVIKKPNFSQPLHVNPVYNLQWAPNLSFEAVEVGQTVDVVGIGREENIDALSIVIDDFQES